MSPTRMTPRVRADGSVPRRDLTESHAFEAIVPATSPTSGAIGSARSSATIATAIVAD